MLSSHKRSDRIVVVDDEAAIGSLVAEAAQLVGLNCTVTQEVEHFLAALGSDVAGVLIDLMIPGTDGVEILRTLGKNAFLPPIILMSGFDRRVLKAASDVAVSLGLHVAGRLEKPFRLEVLIALLTSIRDGAPETTLRAKRISASGAEIQVAIEQQAFELDYQPQIDLRSGHLCGLEALVRMRHPEHGVLQPGAFLPLLIERGWIESLNQITFPLAIREFGLLETHVKTTLSLNILPASLGDLEFPDRLEALAQGSSVATARLMVEVTETGLIVERGKMLDVCSRLRMKGIGLSIDDYGTGYSSMAQLQTIPATELKIDKLFVEDLETDSASRTMVSKTIALGHEMGLRVVAEGNETLGQTNILIRQGCDLGQGYYFSKPIPFAQLQTWIDDHPTINFQRPAP